MNISTPAIVLHLTRVSDKTSILHLYTRECGRVPYYIYGNNRKKGLMYLPLTLLDIEALHLPTREVQQLHDQTVSYVATGISSDIRRQTEAVFIAEILFRTLVHPLSDPLLFDFLASTIRALDQRTDPENVHLEFIAGLLNHLGFGIDFEDPENSALLPLASLPPSSNPPSFGEAGRSSLPSLTRTQRQTLLNHLMTYCEKTVPAWQTPKSLDIMHQIFD